MGNKNDASPEKKVVKTDDAQKFAEQIGVPLYETSAKENQNVEEVGAKHTHTHTHTHTHSYIQHMLVALEAF